MSRTFHRLFVEHPRQVEESYLEHMAASSRFGFRLLKLAACAFAHALVPGVHKATVSKSVCCMAEEMDGRAREARECRMRDAGVWDPGL
ncbi:MAG: hypothetical protein KKE42_05135 [Alphaproteobacteria bacterium]|jgi:hypothetical protein|uniref:DUF6356 family protein n=1 Tax=Brevundimonas sp. TaxID=1871086 RepID=UPI001212D808|nr:DUF6356 family protein [Brevundimonas sp.]MBA3049709.1 hypothetical protein [Brevundimonas sp.]MBU3973166.1 hypothetical protein [Alphaproteobacteria bacterium]MBU4039112.1 hypothetical protein [Alphaproteobacteria bacterium]TAJ63914.1 MAG: hypothetical protein EPO49_05675 [Brevundimonas sp.]